MQKLPSPEPPAQPAACSPLLGASVPAPSSGAAHLGPGRGGLVPRFPRVERLFPWAGVGVQGDSAMLRRARPRAIGYAQYTGGPSGLPSALRWGLTLWSFGSPPVSSNHSYCRDCNLSAFIFPLEVFHILLIVFSSWGRCNQLHRFSALTQHKRLLLAFSGSESGVGLLGLKSGCQQGWFPQQPLGRICFLPFPASRGAHFPWLVAPPPSLKPAVTSSVVLVVPSLWFWFFGLPLPHCRTLVRTVGPSDDPEESLYLRSADEQQP